MKKAVLLSPLFPERCARCDCIPGQRASLCAACKELLLHPSSPQRRCDVCFFLQKDCICGKHQYLKNISASFYYEGEVTSTVFRLKFRSRRDIAASFAQVMYDSLRERDMLGETDIITFIPMRPVASFLRGYNQSRLIAKHLSALTSIPCAPLLYKIGKTKKQHTLRGIERSGNLLGMFEPTKERLQEISDRNILLIDDVYTTGSTLNEAAKTLLIFGAQSVSAAVFSVGKKQKKNR